MVPGSTTTVEIDSALLRRLRDRDPGKSDRILSLARVALGRDAIRQVQTSLALDESEAVAVGARAAREARRELAEERRASGSRRLLPSDRPTGARPRGI
jgi:hypothetical protein